MTRGNAYREVLRDVLDAELGVSGTEWNRAHLVFLGNDLGPHMISHIVSCEGPDHSTLTIIRGKRMALFIILSLLLFVCS